MEYIGRRSIHQRATTVEDMKEGGVGMSSEIGNEVMRAQRCPDPFKHLDF